MKTLDEVVKLVGMSRRVIQEYEAADIAPKPKKRNKYGHLIYEKGEILELWRIRFYRELGYNKKEIKIFQREKTSFATQISELEKKKHEIERLITVAKFLEETGMPPDITFRDGEDLSFSDSLAMLSESISMLNCEKYFDNQNFDRIIDRFGDECFERFETLAFLWNAGTLHESSEIQVIIREIYEVFAALIVDSVFLFSICTEFLSGENELVHEVDDTYGKGFCAFVYGGVKFFCGNSPKSSMDQDVRDGLENIEYYAKNKYTTTSVEVQKEIENIHNLLKKIPILSKDGSLLALKELGELFGTDVYRNALDEGREKGIVWFLSRSIQIYCESTEEVGGGC